MKFIRHVARGRRGRKKLFCVCKGVLREYGSMATGLKEARYGQKKSLFDLSEHLLATSLY
jgi:hypothetical protein